MRGGTMTPTETVLSALRELGHNPKSTHDGWQCCCPAHEDRTPSLSIEVGDDGCALVHCHAGCSIDSICEALKLTKAELFTHNNTLNAQRNSKVRATPKQPPKLFGSAKAALEELEKRKGNRSAKWVYRNANGEPVGIIARWDKSEGGKEIRPISRSDDGKSWISGGMTLPRPLYRLPELLAASASALVYVVEGEKAADAAASLGVVATTSPHGSKSAGKADWSPLSGRSVVILPDNDDAGEQYADDVAKLASAAGAKSVRVVRLAELWVEMPKGGDIVDFLEHRGGEQESVRKEIEALVVDTSEESLVAAEKVVEEDSRKQKSSGLIVDLVHDLYQMKQTHKHEPFAVRRDGSNIAVSLSGPGGKFKDEIAFEYRKYSGYVMNSTAFTDALSALRGEAMNATPESTSIRVGMIEDEVVLDLGTNCGAAVVVGANNEWKIRQRSPIIFQRTALVGQLPMPVSGGSIDSLRKLLNVTEETWPILLGWMVSALIPDMPHPILLLGGGQGSGKTTAARFICGLFDASDVPTRSQPRDPETWAISVASGWTTVIDNVSTISDWWSDALCKAVTGDGWMRRTLYTNNDVSVLSFKRVIVLTSIDAGALRGDLGERIVLVDLEPIPQEIRKTETELNRAYQEAHPTMLGALLDLLAKVLNKIETVKLDQLPRMADFARVLAAIDKTLETHSFALYCDQANRIACDVVESDPIGNAIVGLMSNREEWIGTSSDLLSALKPEDAGRDWKVTPRGFASKLKRIIPALGIQGIKITPPSRNDRPRNYRIETTVGPSDNRRGEKQDPFATDRDSGRSDVSDGRDSLISGSDQSGNWAEL